jgi:hypothetical protein
MRGLFRTDSGVYILVGGLLREDETGEDKSGEQLSHGNRIRYWDGGRRNPQLTGSRESERLI